MRIAIAIFFLLFTHLIEAQQYGAQWVLGDRESVLDFRNNDTVTNYSIGPLMPMTLTNANICDSNGLLLYYTNGIYIAGSDGNQLVNGDSISPCDYSNMLEAEGLDIPQGTLFLPMPGNSNLYCLFHMSNDTLNSGRPGNLYYSVIDITHDSVIMKNIIYYSGIFREGGMTACKHANGRDWWIIMGDRHSSYYKFLLTPNGIREPLIQTIGPSYYTSFDIAYSKFSQDGSKYATSCYQGPILVMDFDRCSGDFSNPIELFHNTSTDSTTLSGASSVEFSSNGRFIYVNNQNDLTQYDLLASIPQDSTELYNYPGEDPVGIGFLQLAPNGKIYCSTWNGGYYYIHALNYPNSKGDTANYVDSAVITSTINSDNFPNMVNYQLGPLIGSGCDTITSASPNLSKGEGLRIMPNPADKYFYVEIGQQGNYEFDLLNELGQIIDKKETRQVDIFNTEGLANGLYFIKAINHQSSDDVAITQRLIITHKN